MKIYWNGERKNVIGSRVKELRKKQDISQKILAARLSLSDVYKRQGNGRFPLNSLYTFPIIE